MDLLRSSAGQRVSVRREGVDEVIRIDLAYEIPGLIDECRYSEGTLNVTRHLEATGTGQHWSGKRFVDVNRLPCRRGGICSRAGEDKKKGRKPENRCRSEQCSETETIPCRGPVQGCLDFIGIHSGVLVVDVGFIETVDVTPNEENAVLLTTIRRRIDLPSSAFAEWKSVTKMKHRFVCSDSAVNNKYKLGSRDCDNQTLGAFRIEFYFSQFLR